MRIAGTIDRAVRSAMRQMVRRAIRETVWFVAIAALVIAGVVFALVAAYQALLIVWPPWGAALACAGAAFAAALLAALVRVSGTDRRPPPPIPAEEAVEALNDDLSRVAESAKQAALDQYRKDPAGTLAGAVAIGAIIGLLKPRD